MKLEVIEPPKPERQFVLTLTEREAGILRAITVSLNSSVEEVDRFITYLYNKLATKGAPHPGYYLTAEKLDKEAEEAA